MKVLLYDDARQIVMREYRRWAEDQEGDDDELDRFRIGAHGACANLLIALHSRARESSAVIPEMGTITHAHFLAAGEKTGLPERALRMLSWAVQNGATVQEMLAWDRAEHGEDLAADT